MNPLDTLLSPYKEKIHLKLDDIFHSNTFPSIRWSQDVQTRIQELTKRGKNIRGSLFLAALDQWTKQHSSSDLVIAAAMELFHTAFLIHDDIIDHDFLRRGIPSIHAQYMQTAKQLHIEKSEEFGTSFAICAGDIAFFTAFQALVSLTYPEHIKQHLTQTLMQEYITVGLGEMQDIECSFLPELPKEEDLITMYTYKTARYTFSLPLVLAAIITEQHQSTQRMLMQAGEYLGIIYQLKDDQLTLFGKEEEVGKTIGNDISENKRTYAFVQLQSKANDTDKHLLKTIFGKSNITEKDISTIQNLMISYGVQQHVESVISSYAEKTEALLSQLSIPKKTFTALFQEILTRTK